MAKIYVADNRYETGVIKMYHVDNRYDADLLFYTTSDRYEADRKDEIWYFVDDKYDATSVVYWVDNRYDADVLVYDVDSRYEAEWRTSNKFITRLS